MNWTRKLLALVGIAVLGLGPAGTALADLTDDAEISVTVNEIPLTVAVTAGSFSAIDFDILPFDSVGTLTIDVTDGRTVLDGWIVAASVSEFTGTGGTPPTFDADIDVLSSNINPSGPSGPLVTLFSNPGNAEQVLELESTNYGGNNAWTAIFDAFVFVPVTVPDTYTSTITVDIIGGNEP